MLLCSDSSSEDGSANHVRQGEGLAARLPEWQDDDSQSGSSTHAFDQSERSRPLRASTLSIRRGRCGSPHPRQVYSTKPSPQDSKKLLFHNLPSPPKPTSPTQGLTPLISPSSPTKSPPTSPTRSAPVTSPSKTKPSRFHNVNNSNSTHSAKVMDKNRIKMGIGASHSNHSRGVGGKLVNGHTSGIPQLVSGSRSQSPMSRSHGGSHNPQQVVRVQVHQAEVTKLQKTKPLPGLYNLHTNCSVVDGAD